MNESINTDLLHLVTLDIAWHYSIVPFTIDDGVLGLYMADDIILTEELQNEIEVMLDKAIIIEFRQRGLITELLNKYYRKNQSNLFNIELQQVTVSNQNFLEKIIQEAEALNSSDIHIEIYEEKARIRYRIDGHLIERIRISLADYPSLINMIKIRSGMDISEKRLPQDGRIFYQHESKKFDIRVSSLPALYGEKIVMRLLTNKIDKIELQSIGMNNFDLDVYTRGLQKPHGIILISGPTGSGKTTTLYATLKYLNNEKRNILTIEDPIEYTLEGVNQVQVKDAIGFTFAQALRTFLRQDPDIIMLGEIRDGETAQMAVRSSLTGHLVLSTIHTNSAIATISRLVDMGVPPFLIANTLNFSIAQRLVRKLCNNCKVEKKIENKYLQSIVKKEIGVDVIYTPVGCNQCYHTGYNGRRAIYEIIEIDDFLEQKIKQNDINEKEILIQKNIKSLRGNALLLLKDGITSLEEIYSLIHN